MKVCTEVEVVGFLTDATGFSLAYKTGLMYVKLILFEIICTAVFLGGGRGGGGNEGREVIESS